VRRTRRVRTTIKSDMEQWTSTEDTRVAAAMGTLGVVVRVKQTLRESTGNLKCRLYLSLTNLEKDVMTKRVITRWKNGRLSKEDPGHAFLTCLRARENWKQLVDCAKRGTCLDLVRVPGTDVYQYVPGKTGLPGTAGHKELIETSDLKMAANLGLIGIPVLAIAGNSGNFRFFLPRYSPVRLDGSRADGVELRASWYRKMSSIPWEEPFAQGCRMLYNMERLLDTINRDLPLVMVEKPKSVKFALIHPEAQPEAWDKIKRAFGG